MGCSVDQITLQGGGSSSGGNSDPHRSQEPQGYGAGGWDMDEEIPFAPITLI